MVENKRNILVGLFVLLGLSALGWMIFKFGDLPTMVSRYDAYEVEIFFPSAPGIKDNSEVLFCGYPVGRVVSVDPPRLMTNLDHQDKSAYQVVVTAAIHRDHEIPKNATAKVYRRGLGGSFLEFVLPPQEPASAYFLAGGDQIQGELSQGNEFLSEATQSKLDDLISSLTSLSRNLESQLQKITPEQVDGADAFSPVYPNVTTAVIRLDRVLKSINQVVGDEANQANVKKSLENLSGLSGELREAAAKIQALTDKAIGMAESGTKAMDRLDETSLKFYESFNASSLKIQTAADEIAKAFGQLDRMLAAATAGDGTASRILNDPKLYESMTDATERLNLALEDFRKLVQQWTEKGMKVKMK